MNTKKDFTDFITSIIFILISVLFFSNLNNCAAQDSLAGRIDTQHLDDWPTYTWDDAIWPKDPGQSLVWGNDVEEIGVLTFDSNNHGIQLLTLKSVEDFLEWYLINDDTYHPSDPSFFDYYNFLKNHYTKEPITISIWQE